MENKKTHQYRSEILFLYDIFRCNPNGDPFENRPRQDAITGRIEVTDVRLKRTIRDYLLNYKHENGKNDGLEIFVRVAGEKALTAERRYEEIFKQMPTPDNKEEARKNLIARCIDVRMFGGLVPITKKQKTVKGDKVKEKEEEGIGTETGEGAGIQLVGAVQFNPGQSLHAVDIVEISGTGGFASSEKAKQKTFRREFFVPYALIGFYGVINEMIARESGLTNEDVILLMESIWNGTLFLHSRSKAFHHPRLLLRFDFKDQHQCGYFLDKIEFLSTKDDEKKIRSPKDYTIKLDDVLKKVKEKRESLAGIYCQLDSTFIIEPKNLKSELVTLLGQDGDKKLSFNQPFNKN